MYTAVCVRIRLYRTEANYTHHLLHSCMHKSTLSGLGAFLRRHRRRCRGRRPLATSRRRITHRWSHRVRLRRGDVLVWDASMVLPAIRLHPPALALRFDQHLTHLSTRCVDASVTTSQTRSAACRRAVSMGVDVMCGGTPPQLLAHLAGGVCPSPPAVGASCWGVRTPSPS